jgi:hypothetical protein
MFLWANFYMVAIKAFEFFGNLNCKFKKKHQKSWKFSPTFGKLINLKKKPMIGTTSKIF